MKRSQFEQTKIAERYERAIARFSFQTRKVDCKIEYRIIFPNSITEEAALRFFPSFKISICVHLVTHVREYHTYTNFFFFSPFAEESYNGSTLFFWKVDRKQMGAYLCVASNDVPPAVSKRIILSVNCEDTLIFFPLFYTHPTR